MRQGNRYRSIMRIIFILICSVTTLFVVSDKAIQSNETYAATAKSYSDKLLIPSGKVIGVTVKSEGICVLGVSSVETQKGESSPAKDLLIKGDIIYKVNDQVIEKKEELKQLVEIHGDEPMKMMIKRNGEEKNIFITPTYVEKEKSYKLGIWIKDGTQGIGTMTYIDPESHRYGALGHGITDTDMARLLPIREGVITPATVTSIRKGKKGEPGKLGGYITKEEEMDLGCIEKNTTRGIYGVLDSDGVNYFEGKRLPVALREEIDEGSAEIWIDLEGKGTTAYTIQIEKVSKYTSEPTKGMVIKIVDKRLIDLTNGIVQGMSGSPIIQNGKIIGAVTHVFVHDPTKGYGIFIENMLNDE